MRTKSRQHSFLVLLKGFFVMHTFIPTDVSSCRQLLTASVTSSVSAVGPMSSISSLTVGTTWRTNPDSPTTSRKAESGFPLSSAAHFTLTWRPFVRVFWIPPILTPSSLGLTRHFRFFKIAA